VVGVSGWWREGRVGFFHPHLPYFPPPHNHSTNPPYLYPNHRYETTHDGIEYEDMVGEGGWFIVFLTVDSSFLLQLPPTLPTPRPVVRKRDKREKGQGRVVMGGCG